MKHSRSCCPVACTLDILGDKWTLLVVRDLFLGKSQFKEFSASPEGIATNVLSDRLVRLTQNGLVEKFPAPDQPGHDAYRLTARGKTLKPVLEAIFKWGLRNVPDSASGLWKNRTETRL